MADRIHRAASRLAALFAVLRTHDFERYGVPRHCLKTLVDEGLWERTGRGLYRPSQSPPGPHHSLLEIARHSPLAVVCLLSALRFHELTTETPSEVWIALPRNASTPRNAVVRLKAVHLTGAAFSKGIEQHRIEGVVADCFKFWNQLDTQVAVEALRDA